MSLELKKQQEEALREFLYYFSIMVFGTLLGQTIYELVKDKTKTDY